MRIIETTKMRAAALLLAFGLLLVCFGPGCRGERGSKDDSAAPLTDKEISDAFTARLQAVEACIAKGRAGNQALGGTLTAAGLISPEGRVDRVRVRFSGAGDSRLERCISDVVREMSFRPSRDEAVFEQSWSLGVARPAAAPAFDDDWGGFGEELSEIQDAASVPMEPHAVEMLARRDSEALDACHKAALEYNPMLEGEVEIKWTVDERGAVTGTVLTGAILQNTNMADCIERVVRSWRFAPGSPNTIRQASFTLTYEAE